MRRNEHHDAAERKRGNGLETHELAMLLPEMSQHEYEALKNDIKARGQIEPILTYQGKILDSRHRYRACKELRKQPVVEFWMGEGDPLAFVVSKNLHRRHLSSGQLAILAVEIEPRLAELAHERQRAAGGNRKAVGEGMPQAQENGTKGRARDQAAFLVGTNPRYVSDAKNLCKADPRLAAKVKAGKMTLPEAMDRLKAHTPPAQNGTGRQHGKSARAHNGRGVQPALNGAEHRTGANGRAADKASPVGGVLQGVETAELQLARNTKVLDRLAQGLKKKQRERLTTLLHRIRGHADRMIKALKADKARAMPANA